MTLLISAYNPTNQWQLALSEALVKESGHSRIIITGGASSSVQSLLRNVPEIEICLHNQESLFYSQPRYSNAKLNITTSIHINSNILEGQYRRLVPPYCYFGIEEINNHAQSILNTWIKILDRENLTKAFFASTPHVASDFILMLACCEICEKSIVFEPVSSLGQSMSGGFGYLWEGSKHSWVDVDTRKYYCNSPIISKNIEKSLRLYSNQFNSLRGKSTFSNQRRSLDRIRNSLANISTDRAKSSFVATIKDLWSFSITSYLGSPEPQMPHVLAYLNVDPEASFSPCSGIYNNTIQWLWDVSNKLGKYAHIVFKEHPVMLEGRQLDGLFLYENALQSIAATTTCRYRSLDFVETMKAFPSFWYSIFENFEIKPNGGNIFLTNSGTIAIEAACSGNPVIISGNMHKIPLSDVAGVYHMEQFDASSPFMLNHILDFSQNSSKRLLLKECALRACSLYLNYNPFYCEQSSVESPLIGSFSSSSLPLLSAVRL